VGRPRRLTHCNAASLCNAQAFAIARLANVTSMRKGCHANICALPADTATLTLLHTQLH
jgi:hypothetical protein